MKVVATPPGEDTISEEPTADELAQAAIDAQPKNATEFDVKQEAGRRIMLLVGADSKDGMVIKEMNAIMRGVFLNDKRYDGVLTSEEQAEVAQLKALKVAIDAIRSASNAIEQAPPTINNLQTDSRWPS